MQLKEYIRGIMYVVAFLGPGIFLGFCVVFWLQTPPSKASQLRPLIKEIDAYKAEHGKYPTSCEQFASFARLTNQFSVYAGSTNQGGIRYWNYWDVAQHDFTVLLNADYDEKDVYEIFLPIAGTERMHKFSFNFAAWRYDFKNGRWQKGRIYYSSFGPYWKPNFLR